MKVWRLWLTSHLFNAAKASRKMESDVGTRSNVIFSFFSVDIWLSRSFIAPANVSNSFCMLRRRSLSGMNTSHHAHRSALWETGSSVMKSSAARRPEKWIGSTKSTVAGCFSGKVFGQRHCRDFSMALKVIERYKSHRAPDHWFASVEFVMLASSAACRTSMSARRRHDHLSI